MRPKYVDIAYINETILVSEKNRTVVCDEDESLCRDPEREIGPHPHSLSLGMYLLRPHSDSV